MKIAVVVHGRFHAFDLVREMLARSHDVTLFTNYPAWACRRFDLPAKNIRSFWPHGVIARASNWMERVVGFRLGEAGEHSLFGRWAAHEVAAGSWDIVHCFSGVAEELFRTLGKAGPMRQLVRASAHIRVQDRILAEEEKRTGFRVYRPSSWMIAREEREYALADCIVVPSHFAYDSFIEMGMPASKLAILTLGARLSTFQAPAAVVEARVQRIRSGAPLRVLYVGALSLQKGMWDLAAVVRRADSKRFQFTLVGPRTVDGAALADELSSRADVVGKKPQDQLPEWYANSDVFIFPTLHDGFPNVLAQAQVSGLPILMTPHCSGSDLVREGKSGWILPIRNPDAFLDRLEWCDHHREELSEMASWIATTYALRDWSQVAADFEAVCAEGLRHDRCE